MIFPFSVFIYSTSPEPFSSSGWPVVGPVENRGPLSSTKNGILLYEMQYYGLEPRLALYKSHGAG